MNLLKKNKKSGVGSLTDFLKKNNVVIFFIIWFAVFLLLSIFRDPRLDENIYLNESSVIADLLRQGKWIGNYAVGLHGFISKLVAGIIFLVTGPSVFIATLLNIVLGVLSGLIFYKVLHSHFRLSKSFALVGVSFLFTSYQFLYYVPTFYRDIGALFFLLLLVESILSDRSKLLSGLYLLMVLDFKEHVFFTIAPAIVIWGILEILLHKDIKLLKRFGDLVISQVKIFIPSLVFLILMFCTSLIPLNMYNANVLGLVEKGFTYVASGFEIERATFNQDVENNPEEAKSVPTEVIESNKVEKNDVFITVFNSVFAYLGKILYPRTFSFLSIPFVVLMPCMYVLFEKTKVWYKNKDLSKLFISTMVIVYIGVYVLRASLGRYLLPISPLIYLFFILFLKDLKRYIKVKGLVVLTVILTLSGLYFEYSYIGIKTGMAVFISGMFIYGLIRKRFKWKLFKNILILIICMFSAGSSILTSITLGQIKNSLLYGYNRECNEIVNIADADETLWINDIGWDRLPYFFRSENIQKSEWRWSLYSWVPKKNMLISGDIINTYNYELNSESGFIERSKELGLDKVMYIKLEKLNERESIDFQDKLEFFDNNEAFKKVDTIEMRNKTVYVYDTVFE